ncbi:MULTISPECIES: protein TolQ [unclassified Paracoccus (in: a-proteobacteria)]|uniref:protein TolQ n=1 Tax=unclassified Paracoccus (in: a-proteobacteria) TaxID=2688777 RepID=UPI0016009574|nr:MULTISPECIES: protein TolQ [unclassified Paracoccus (in: a-proteobacteria)]MBB1491119.1 protein TolQ [Paracoccus sp. MC1854]MBB1497066.1 protein TolQ [Paracoccus sp. MC1862]QQO44533.1 protein TolQ [Paracoccus sp. MC1862]
MENLAIGAPTDFSLIALFLRAGLTVKIVMVLLVLASVWSWALIVQKTMVQTAARRDSTSFDRRFWSGEPLDDVFDRMNGRARGPAERIFSAGMGEWRRSQTDDGGLIPGVMQRVDRAMNVAIGRESDRLTRGLPILASIGSTAPFIGLFGTVWGIKTAFEGIALSQDTSLAVVAPGIAEALVATALGLLAAIPAVIFYNKLSSDANRISGGHEAFADEFATILSRQTEAG